MTTLTTFLKTDGVDDHVANDVNVLIAAALRAEYANTETISATKELADIDCPFQIIAASGATRTVELAPEASTNHVTIIYNTSVSNSVVVKDDSGTTTFITLAPDQWAMFIPVLGETWKVIENSGTLATYFLLTTGLSSWSEQSSTPSSPAASKMMLYFKNDEKLYKLNSGGTETEIGAAADGWTLGTGTWTYSSADAPTFIISINADVTALIAVGDRIKLTQTTAKYFIVTAVGAYSAGATLVTVYGGTDYTLANAAITSPYYSHIKSPFGFPINPDKWTVLVTDTADRTQATPTTSTWYNLGSLTISIPIGLWSVTYKVLQRPSKATATTTNMYSTLSTANNSSSDADFNVLTTIAAGSATLTIVATAYCFPKILTIASKTSYYLNGMTSVGADSIGHRGDVGTTVIKAICAYL